MLVAGQVLVAIGRCSLALGAATDRAVRMRLVGCAAYDELVPSGAQAADLAELTEHACVTPAQVLGNFRPKKHRDIHCRGEDQCACKPAIITKSRQSHHELI